MSSIHLNKSDDHRGYMFSDADLTILDVYSSNNDRVGRVVEEVIDRESQSHYLLVRLINGATNKEVLLPVEQLNVNLNRQRVDVEGLTTIQLYQLPSSSSYSPVSDRTPPPASTQQSYASPQLSTQALENEQPLENSTPLEGPVAVESVVRLQPSTVLYQDSQAERVMPQSRVDSTNQSTPTAAQLSTHEPAVAEESLQEQTIQLLEERVVSDRQRRKVGEVVIRKAIETRMVEVPIRREVLIVEQVSPDRHNLATIDLGLEAQSSDRDRLFQTNASDSLMSTTGQPDQTLQNIQYVPITAAQKLIDSVISKPETQSTRVALIFEEDSVQQAYEQWLQRQTSHQ
ncbi:PRC-barrel domain-containing protein [Leptolyngbya sp. AN02str]|uniref:PRC-barrel domain-containing protein n=1 Tax=Leptolyngbya sp. AN02str TaxID=3423363 RepID=UPI003D31C8C7